MDIRMKPSLLLLGLEQKNPYTLYGELLNLQELGFGCFLVQRYAW